MGLPTNPAKAERRAMIALVAVFALFVQALMPAFAVAGPMPDGAGVICTAMGLQAAPDGDTGPPPADHACKHCLCPAPVAAPPVVASVEPVAYAVLLVPTNAASRTLPPPARGPPRPPGQGPPLPNA